MGIQRHRPERAAYFTPTAAPRDIPTAPPRDSNCALKGQLNTGIQSHRPERAAYFTPTATPRDIPTAASRDSRPDRTAAPRDSDGIASGPICALKGQLNMGIKRHRPERAIYFTPTAAPRDIPTAASRDSRRQRLGILRRHRLGIRQS
jgi:hypothetical protein